MDRQAALQAYIQAIMPEREAYLLQRAMNKVRAITLGMSPEEADENSQFMIDNMFEDNRDVIGIAWEDVEPTEPRAGENLL
jgi:hypothetical protein